MAGRQIRPVGPVLLCGPSGCRSHTDTQRVRNLSMAARAHGGRAAGGGRGAVTASGGRRAGGATRPVLASWSETRRSSRQCYQPAPTNRRSLPVAGRRRAITTATSGETGNTRPPETPRLASTRPDSPDSRRLAPRAAIVCCQRVIIRARCVIINHMETLGGGDPSASAMPARRQ